MKEYKNKNIYLLLYYLFFMFFISFFVADKPLNEN